MYRYQLMSRKTCGYERLVILLCFDINNVDLYEMKRTFELFRILGKHTIIITTSHKI
jgi:uncharacterized membrane protein YcfT